MFVDVKRSGGIFRKGQPYSNIMSPKQLRLSCSLKVFLFKHNQSLVTERYLTKSQRLGPSYSTIVSAKLQLQLPTSHLVLTLLDSTRIDQKSTIRCKLEQLQCFQSDPHQLVPSTDVNSDELFCLVLDSSVKSRVPVTKPIVLSCYCYYRTITGLLLNTDHLISIN